jgi:hypothetical protein
VVVAEVVVPEPAAPLLVGVLAVPVAAWEVELLWLPVVEVTVGTAVVVAPVAVPDEAPEPEAEAEAEAEEEPVFEVATVAMALHCSAATA